MQSFGSFRRSLLLIVVALLLAGCAPGGNSGGGAGTADGILLVTVDGLIPEHISLFGGPIAIPALDRFQESGTVWQDAWTAVPLIRPAVATYMTGAAPDRHLITDDVTTEPGAGLPTLAEALSSRGYSTAAFPGSSTLDFDSGLLRGFEVIDDPPDSKLLIKRFLPRATPARKLAGNFVTWLDGVPEGEKYFGWIHFSHPLLAQISKDEEKAGKKIDGFREALATVLDAVDARGDAGRSLIVLAGTFGDISGGDDDLPGLGFSLRERAIQIPLMARFPAGTDAIRPPEQPVWAPDVATTVAAFGGVELSGAEGIDLRESVPTDRVIYSWSWATLQQFGWKPQRVVRIRDWKRFDGLTPQTVSLSGSDSEPDGATEERLVEALADRPMPLPVGVPVDSVASILEETGRTLAPLPEGGREFGTAEERRAVAGDYLLARKRMYWGVRRPLARQLEEIQSRDPENLIFSIDRFALGVPEGPELMAAAVERYPFDADALHWYAHSIWKDNWQAGSRIIDAVRQQRPNDSDMLYDLACARSLAEDLAGAEELLRASIEAGYREWEAMASDPDLRNLRESGQFAAVLRDFRR